MGLGLGSEVGPRASSASFLPLPSSPGTGRGGSGVPWERRRQGGFCQGLMSGRHLCYGA